MRLLFAGTPEPAVPALEALFASPHEIVAVLTRPDAPAGRGRHLTPSPVAVRAEEFGIEVLKYTNLRDPDVLARLAELAPDVAPIVAYGAVVPKEALDVPRHGWVNLHFSLLPAWRGAAPVQHAIMAGDEVTGATTFRLEASLDTGPVFGVVTTPVGPYDTSGDLLERLAHSGADLLLATLDGIDDGSLVAQPQRLDGVSLAPKVTVDDARVDWQAPALAVDRLVRSCTPEPGAWTIFRGERLKLAPLTVAPGYIDLAPGAVRVTRRGVLVGTGGGVVQLGDVAGQGKKRMPALDWARGVRPSDYDTLV